MEQQDALVGSVALRGRAKKIDKLHECLVEPEDRVRAALERVGEEMVTDGVLLESAVALHALAHHRVVGPLIGVAHHTGVLLDDLEVVIERAGPVHVPERAAVHLCVDDAGEVTAAGGIERSAQVAAPGGVGG